MEKESLKIDDLRPHFFKIIYGEDVKQHLRIPSAFMKHLPQEMPNRAILIGPFGSHWRVRVSMDENGTYIQKGWKEFMKENNLGDNEFLTFRYDGNMQFHVKIFNKSGVIRPAAPVSNTNNVKRGRGRPRKRPVGSLDIHKQELHGSEEGRGQSCRIGKMAKTSTSQSLHFMASMTRSNVETSFILRMPRSFSTAAHFPPSRSKVVLRDSAGKAWDVILLYDRGCHYFSGGWVSFARHNHLKIGDVCKFELLNIHEMQELNEIKTSLDEREKNKNAKDFDEKTIHHSKPASEFIFISLHIKKSMTRKKSENFCISWIPWKASKVVKMHSENIHLVPISEAGVSPVQDIYSS